MHNHNSKNKIINFCVVYCKTKKKIDKYFKVNKIRNKYVLDIKKLVDEELDGDSSDKMILKVIIFNKIQAAMEKGRDIYFIPNFDEDFSMTKLLNLKQILGGNNFNILVFYDEFKAQPNYLAEALENLSRFDCSQILRDY